LEGLKKYLFLQAILKRTSRWWKTFTGEGLPNILRNLTYPDSLSQREVCMQPGMKQKRAVRFKSDQSVGFFRLLNFNNVYTPMAAMESTVISPIVSNPLKSTNITFTTFRPWAFT
jgi:hypothetical protein